MKIAFAGKGGTGKTTLAAWTADYLARQGQDVWLIDADTAMSLGRASGLEPDDLPEPLTAQKDLIQERIGAGLINLNPDVGDIPDELAVDVPVLGPLNDGIAPGRKRLLVMGTIATAGGGCACGANALLKAVLAHLLYDEKDWIIIDLEAGIEHLGRGTAAQADAMAVVTEPSLRSFETATKVVALAQELNVKRQVLLINRTPMTENGEVTLPDHLRGSLPEIHLAIPEMEGLKARMQFSAAVLPIAEQEKVGALIATFLAYLK